MTSARSPPAVSIIIDTCHGKWLSRSGEDLRNIGKIERRTDQRNVNFYEKILYSYKDQKQQTISYEIVTEIMPSIYLTIQMIATNTINKYGISLANLGVTPLFIAVHLPDFKNKIHL